MNFTQTQIDEHAARLLTILDNRYPCTYCPWFDRVYFKGRDFSSHCEICHNFIGITFIEDEKPRKHPCDILGPEEAIKRTWLELERRGYLI